MSTCRVSQTRIAKRSRPKGRRSKLSDDVLLQPWFLPKKTAFAILRLLPPGYRQRMLSYFADYGCLRCNHRNVLYGSNGLCERCKITIQWRLVRCVRRRLNGRVQPPPASEPNKDMVRMEQARDLLRDLATNKLKGPASYRMRKSYFVNPDRGSYSPSIRR